MTDLNRAKNQPLWDWRFLNPDGTPANVTVWGFGSSGHAIHKDGTVWLMRDGEWRQATRDEALKLRTDVRRAFGESIADIAGIEPE